MLLRVFSEMNFVLYPAHAAAAIDAISFMAGITPKCTSKHMCTLVHKNKTPTADFSTQCLIFPRGHIARGGGEAARIKFGMLFDEEPRTCIFI